MHTQAVGVGRNRSVFELSPRIRQESLPTSRSVTRSVGGAHGSASELMVISSWTISAAHGSTDAGAPCSCSDSSSA